jgi:hypothetical protein
MINNVVYTITVLDLKVNLPLGYRTTPVILTELKDAIYIVKNNLRDIADESTYQYAVIEKTLLNEIRPNLEADSLRLWYKHNSITNEFEPCEAPAVLRHQTGFGIG